MAEAAEIHGVVFKQGSATLLARVVDADGNPLSPAGIRQAQYSVWLLDPNDADAAETVEGHESVEIPVGPLVLAGLRRDALWDVDDVGYNFEHVMNVSQHAAFPIAGRCYRVEFRLTPTVGQVILVRFRVYAI
jgi:hypothetical protein